MWRYNKQCSYLCDFTLLNNIYECTYYHINVKKYFCGGDDVKGKC